MAGTYLIPETKWIRYDTTASETGSEWSNLYANNSTAATERIYAHKMINKIEDCMLNYCEKKYDSITYNYSENKYDIGTGSLAWKEYDFFSNATTSLTAGNYIPWGGDIPLGGDIWSVPTPGDRIRQMIRDRMAPAIHRGHKRRSLSIAMDVREERARQTLRRVIGEQSYRKFIRDGFITVVPKSGLAYRIFPGHGMTEVYDRGVQVDLLCVVLNGQFPPTDSLLMRYLLILNDEGEFSKYAIKHHVSPRSSKLVLPTLVVPLTEAWAELKVA